MVSIIIPMYNAMDTIERCINSIKNQTYKEWEAIIVDDASCDNSVAICKDLIKGDERFHIYQLENNGGPATARNYGLTKSIGEWITFIDSDDEIDEKCLELAVREAHKQGADVVLWGLVNLIDDSVESYQRTFLGDERVFAGNDMANVISLLYTVKGEDNSDSLNLRGPVAKLISSTLTEKTAFPEGIRVGEDICYIRQLLDNCNKLAYINDVLYYRHIRENSLSYSAIPDANEGKRRADATNWLIRYNEENAKIKVTVNYSQVMYGLLTSVIRSYIHVIPQIPLSVCRNVIKQCQKELIYEIDFSQVKDKNSFLVRCVKMRWYYTYKVFFVLNNLLNR